MSSGQLPPNQPTEDKPNQSNEDVDMSGGREGPITLEQVPPQETPPQETIFQQTTFQQTPPQETPPQETIFQQVPPQETIFQQTTFQQTPPQETPPQEIPPQETTFQQTPPQETPPQETIFQQATPQQTPPQQPNFQQAGFNGHPSFARFDPEAIAKRKRERSPVLPSIEDGDDNRSFNTTKRTRFYSPIHDDGSMEKGYMNILHPQIASDMKTCGWLISNHKTAYLNRYGPDDAPCFCIENFSDEASRGISRNEIMCISKPSNQFSIKKGYGLDDVKDILGVAWPKDLRLDTPLSGLRLIDPRSAHFANPCSVYIVVQWKHKVDPSDPDSAFEVSYEPRAWGRKVIQETPRDRARRGKRVYYYPSEDGEEAEINRNGFADNELYKIAVIKEKAYCAATGRAFFAEREPSPMEAEIGQVRQVSESRDDTSEVAWEDIEEVARENTPQNAPETGRQNTPERRRQGTPDRHRQDNLEAARQYGRQYTPRANSTQYMTPPPEKQRTPEREQTRRKPNRRQRRRTSAKPSYADDEDEGYESDHRRMPMMDPRHMAVIVSMVQAYLEQQRNEPHRVSDHQRTRSQAKAY